MNDNWRGGSASIKAGLIAFLVLLTLFIASCNPQPLPVEPTPIPTLISATLPADYDPPTPPPIGAGDAEAGAQVFETYCSVCHSLTAEAGVGPGLAGLFDRDMLPNDQPIGDENLAEWISTGGGAMPGVPLSEGEVEQLIAFLREATQ
jgi:mono/diheme cytochrome c family protein